MHAWNIIKMLKAQRQMSHKEVRVINIIKFKGGSPGLVFMGGDSCSKGRGFESRRRMLDCHNIFHIGETEVGRNWWSDDCDVIGNYTRTRFTDTGKLRRPERVRLHHRSILSRLERPLRRLQRPRRDGRLGQDGGGHETRNGVGHESVGWSRCQHGKFEIFRAELIWFPEWAVWPDLAKFLIWQNTRLTLANLWHYWANFHRCKWPNIEK